MKFFKTIFLVWIFSSALFANRVIIDQLGREVSLPDEVKRMVVLQHQSLNLLNEINAMDKVVGVLKSWEKNLGKDYVRLAPSLSTLPIAGDLNEVNYESILALKPDVVIVANYLNSEYINKLSELKVPVVAMSFFKSSTQANRLNPSLEDASSAYDDGFYEGARLLGDISGNVEQADELIKFVKRSQDELKRELEFLKTEPKRTRLYMANPNLTTYGSGKYTSVLFERAGGINVAASSIKGYKQVNAEQISSFNPDVIFIQHRYASSFNDIVNELAIANTKASKEGQIYLMPQYAKAWGYPTAEAMALGELWVAKTLYKDRLSHIDLDAKVQEFYYKFYRTNYQ